jgi:hypothetical protein
MTRARPCESKMRIRQFRAPEYRILGLGRGLRGFVNDRDRPVRVEYYGIVASWGRGGPLTL